MRVSFHTVIVVCIVVDYLVPQVVSHPFRFSIVFIVDIQGVLESGLYVLLRVQQIIDILCHSFAILGVHLLF